MQDITQEFTVPYQYKVVFTESLFDLENESLIHIFTDRTDNKPFKVLCVFDEEMAGDHPTLFEDMRRYSAHHNDLFEFVQSPILIPGGETAKNDAKHVDKILQAVHEGGIDRHSYIIAIGGGALIDTAGYAAGIAHRGIRMVRIPTTVLAQNDASLGVKNGINAFGKKNFLGTFVPPYAVINDSSFLTTLNQRDWVSGISEAIKVALLKDPVFFEFIKENAKELNHRHLGAMEKLIYRCAELHLEHIATSGDPFEMGSSRPLDFGHWAAHKLEQLTNFELRHGEAVAIGIALDITYSYLIDLISEEEWKLILDVIKESGFKLYIPELQSNLENPQEKDSLLYGLTEFREHLGGQLTIMLIEGIGMGIEVHEVDLRIYKRSIEILAEVESTKNEVIDAT